MKINSIDWLAMTLVIIGGLNWGLVGLFEYDLVAALFGDATGLTRTIYGLVGISALYMVVTASKMSSRKANVAPRH